MAFVRFQNVDVNFSLAFYIWGVTNM